MASILGALGILVLGWIVGLVMRAGIEKGLGKLKVNQQLRPPLVGLKWTYLILLLVLVGIFNALHLKLVSGPLGTLVDQVPAFLSRDSWLVGY